MARHAVSTRDRLVLAACQLIWARSYGMAGVDEVCRLADARKGSFYHFFPSKAALAVEALALAWRRVEQEVYGPVDAGPTRGVERLRALVTRLDTFQRSGPAGGAPFPGSPFGQVGQEMAHQDTELRAAVADYVEAQCRYLQRWLDEAVDLEQIPPGDTGARARRALALVEGALLLAKVSGVPSTFRQVCEALPALAMAEPAPPAAAPNRRPPALPEFD